MDQNTIQKLSELEKNLSQIENELTNNTYDFSSNEYNKLIKNFYRLKNINKNFIEWKKLKTSLEENSDLMKVAEDNEIISMIKDEQNYLEDQIKKLELEIEDDLLPKDTEEDLPCYLEIRAGTGGEEASLFCNDLFRMYSLYSQKMGWILEIEDKSVSESGGLKEVILKISGNNAYGSLRHETGGHRVQRVPTTESQGRVHTSACTVMALPELEKSELPTLKLSELRIDTFRASGAGGQHVNKTDSAVRITHIPTGLVATCQNGRSQHQNKEYAMNQLTARLIALKREEENKKNLDIRNKLLSSGNRTDRIRTYNFPQNRVTDHRINFTVYQLDAILNGNLEVLTTPIIKEYRIERIKHFQNINQEE